MIWRDLTLLDWAYLRRELQSKSLLLARQCVKLAYPRVGSTRIDKLQMFSLNHKFPVTTFRLYNRLDNGKSSSTTSLQALRNFARLLETRTLKGTHRPPNNVLYNDLLDNHNGSIRQGPRQRPLCLLHRPLRRGLYLPLPTHETHRLHDDTSLSTTTHKYAPFTCKVNRRLWLAETVTLTHSHITHYIHLFSCFSWLDYHTHTTPRWAHPIHAHSNVSDTF